MKTRKWYCNWKVTPNKYSSDYIIMTDMGYIFHAEWTKEGWFRLNERDYRCYFEKVDDSSIIKWMKVL